jgi:Ni/Co efflux regulator RcnB
MTPLRILTSALILSAFGAGAALADPPRCPPGQAKKGNCVLWYDEGHWRGYRDEDRAYEQGFRDGRRAARWEIGRPLSRDVDYIVIHDYDRHHLRPPPSGYYYAQVDDRVLLVEAATQLVLEALVRHG